MDRKRADDEPLRLNGFERPFHPLQVLSWIVFGCDVICFCIFAIPLIRTAAAQLAVSMCYALSVVSLVLAAVKATGKDPSDPHVHLQDSDMQLKDEDVDSLPFCTTCNTHVFASSKHCRACNKCIVSFDHHCHWLNNCIGQRNYRPFAVCISSVAVMTGICLSTCVYLFIDYFTDEEALELRLETAWLFPSVPPQAVLSILLTIASLNLPLFFLDLQLLMLHIFLFSQNLTTYEYIMNKCSDEDESGQAENAMEDSVDSAPQQLESSGGSASSSSAPTPAAENNPPPPTRGWRRVKGIRKLPRCMDWIVYARCGRSRRRRKKDRIEQIEAQGDDLNNSESHPVPVPNTPSKETAHDRSVEQHSPSPPGSTVDPLGEILKLESIPDIAVCTANQHQTGGTVTVVVQSRPRVIGSPRENQEGGELSGGQTNEPSGVSACLNCGSASDADSPAPQQARSAAEAATV